ncbi:hypothetical protein CROQUDRAFT_96149 [Cronartium quercuum f. sp. fusiforme G11]|uniref:Uncharacterized protein n=1 Tax=Cronartium quercuum f. sp. fusiforme G11 TaxID=708437 RepID=A0A9P6TAG0_9BASI|nr:hypothetical protein CROQUDRAFT_96149 [Cronartium quercuum f. sp. fusiforme G11]
MSQGGQSGGAPMPDVATPHAGPTPSPAPGPSHEDTSGAPDGPDCPTPDASTETPEAPESTAPTVTSPMSQGGQSGGAPTTSSSGITGVQSAGGKCICPGPVPSASSSDKSTPHTSPDGPSPESTGPSVTSSTGKGNMGGSISATPDGPAAATDHESDDNTNPATFLKAPITTCLFTAAFIAGISSLST